MQDYFIILTWMDKATGKVTTTMKLSFQKEQDANRAYEANSQQAASLPYEIVAHKLY